MKSLNMPMQEYQADPAISKSKLDLIHRSPAHYREWLKNKPEPTEAMRWGSMLHSYILEPDLFDAEYAVMTEKIDKRTKEGKQAWLDWQDANEGKTAVDKPTLDVLDGMRDAIFSHSKAKNALLEGVPETSIFWNWNGIDCKARLDFISSKGLIVDLKTCVDARPTEFARACANFRYYVQAAYYVDGYYRTFGEYPVNFLFIAVEKTPPYAVALYTADQMLDQGYREFEQNLITYAECVNTNNWPAYTEDVCSLILPKWAQEAA